MGGDLVLSRRQKSEFRVVDVKAWTDLELNRLAQYVEDEPLRKKAALDAQKAKLEALEKQLGINSSAGAGSSSEKGKGKEPEPVAGKKHRFDDTEYLEQSEAIVDNVKNAVTAGESTAFFRC